MSTEVVMPQMGESITEGTITKWIKKVGETVAKDEPLFEISTDKVDAEIPSPAEGVVLEIRHQEGETVEVNKVVAVIGAAGAAPVGSGNGHPAAQPVEVAEEPPTPAIIAEAAVAPSVPAPAENGAPADDATEVVMPQMGESITEGTITKWLKKAGEKVDRDEPFFEISTDKVDAEIPAPVGGTVLQILHQEGETVEVGKVVALIGAEGVTPVAASNGSKQEETKTALSQQPTAVSPQPQAATATASASVMPAAVKTSGDLSLDELRRAKSSPLVRNIAKQHGVDLARIPGSGASGRVTKKDILSFIETGAALKPQDLMVGKAAPGALPAATRATGPSPAPAKPAFTAPVLTAAAGDRVEPMSVMRKKIAEHMVFSKQTSAHVTSVYEIDMTNVAKFRSQNKDAFFSQYGTKLTFMPFIFQAVVQALRQFPIVNSQVNGDAVIYKGDVNLGMAVALDWGLIVPVIKKADQMSLSGLALTANDLADRARTKKLNPDEVQGGTFTITNPGVFGGLFGTPIINQPQVAILCVGTIEKRPKVLTTPEGDDYIAVRSMAYFALTYDHRVVDGADAEKFLSFMKKYLENTQFTL